MSWFQVSKTDVFMALPIYDVLMVRRNGSARLRKEGTQGAVSFLREKKKSEVAYLKTQIQ